MKPSPPDHDPWSELTRRARRSPDPRANEVAMPPGFAFRAVARWHAEADELQTEADLIALLRRVALVGVSVVLLSLLVNYRSLLGTATTVTAAEPADLVTAALFPN